MSIPQSFIDDLLSRIDIVDFIGSKIALKKSGANFSACCPFHNERTPSFTVSPSKQFFYCFGCGAHGSAIGFLMQSENLNFPQAVENLATQFNLELPKNQQTKREQNLKPIIDVLAAANEYYKQCLRKHELSQEAVNYLKARGLSGQTAKNYQIGFAPAGWDNCLSYLLEKGFNPKDILAAGVIGEAENGRRYDRFRSRIIFPIQNSKGQTIAFGGRVLNDDLPKYLNSPETRVFAKHKELYGFFETKKANRTLESVLVVEGYMDVVALANAGINNAVAALGTAISESHCRLLLRQTNKIIFSFDGDLAGRKAAWRALEICLPLMDAGKSVYFLFLPENEDPDSFISTYGLQAFKEQLQQAITISDYFFNKLSENIDLATMEGKSQLISLATARIEKMPQNIFSHMLLQKLSDVSGVAIGDLKRYSKPKANTAQIRRETIAPKAVIKPKRGMLTPTERAISLLLQQPDLAATNNEKLNEIIKLDKPQIKILQKLVKSFQITSEGNLGSILTSWDDEQESRLLAYLASIHWPLSKNALTEEFQATINKLNSEIIRQQEQALIDKCARLGFDKLSVEEKKQLDTFFKQNNEKTERNQ